MTKKGLDDFAIKAANPIVLFMFVKMTYLAWKNYSERNWALIAHKKAMGMNLEEMDQTESSDSEISDFEEEECDPNIQEENEEGYSHPESNEEPSERVLRLPGFMENVEFQKMRKNKEHLSIEVGLRARRFSNHINLVPLDDSSKMSS